MTHSSQPVSDRSSCFALVCVQTWLRGAPAGTAGYALAVLWGRGCQAGGRSGGPWQRSLDVVGGAGQAPSPEPHSGTPASPGPGQGRGPSRGWRARPGLSRHGASCHRAPWNPRGQSSPEKARAPRDGSAPTPGREDPRALTADPVLPVLLRLLADHGRLHALPVHPETSWVMPGSRPASRGRPHVQPCPPALQGAGGGAPGLPSPGRDRRHTREPETEPGSAVFQAFNFPYEDHQAPVFLDLLHVVRGRAHRIPEP